ncbi:MAG: biotin/lipoyl-containing protein [Gemmatimonadota bacterium]
MAPGADGMTDWEARTTWFVEIGSETYEVIVTGDGVIVNGQAVKAHLQPMGTCGEALLRYNGRSIEVCAKWKDRLWTIDAGGRIHTVRVRDERFRHIEQLAGSGPAVVRENILRAPMPGLIVRVQVENGQAVLEGTPIVVMEAMKMENELTAQAAGTVAAIEVQEGATVNKNDVLVRFEP